MKGMAAKLIKMPESVKYVIDVLNNKNYEAYLVGGCVRDSLLGKKPNDWDIATNATLDVLNTLFNNRLMGNTESHQTITALVGTDKIEISLYRSAENTIEADLCRRDLTINAMAYHPKEGLLDFYGGKNDIEHKIIRATQDPSARIVEDPIRILRALRFASLYDWTIDKETENEMFSYKFLLEDSFAERIRPEITKMLIGKGIARILSKYIEIYETVMPQIMQVAHLRHIINYISNEIMLIPSVPLLRWMKFLYLIDRNIPGWRWKVAASKNIVQSLKFSNNEIREICAVIKAYDLLDEISLTNTGMKQYLRLVGEQIVKDILILRQNDFKDIKIAEKLFESIINNNECFNIKMLTINGDDLLNIGFIGRKVGSILEYLLTQVIQGKVENSKECLIKEAMSCL